MVRIPTFTRRSDAPAARDGGLDERIEDRAATGRAAVDTAPVSRHAAGETSAATADKAAAEQAAAEQAAADKAAADKAAADKAAADKAAAAEQAADRRDQMDDRAVYRSRAAVATDAVAAEQEARQAGAERVEAERAAARTEEAGPEETAVVERPVEPVRRARTSMMASLGLALSVVAAVGVLSGRLAAYGLAVGVVALLLSIAGMSATRRRHVAGKGDAMLGLLLSLGAVVAGILALSGALPWLTTDTDTVGRVRDWLDARWNAYF